MLRNISNLAAWRGLLLTLAAVASGCSGADSPAAPAAPTDGVVPAPTDGVPPATEPGAATPPLPDASMEPSTTELGTPCLGDGVLAPKRLVRLSFNQIANSVRTLLGDTLAAQLAQAFEIGNAEARTFPPLASPREGANIIDDRFSVSDGIAEQAAQYVLDNVATVTGCGANPTDACAQQFLSQFAERAFRRPVAQAELGRLLEVYSGVVAAGGSIQEGVQFGVYATLSSPHFLYRTEVGSDAVTTGALAPYEMANHLAFFLTDAPPDDLLVQAAAAGQLATREQIVAQVDRVLQTDAARINLQTAMFAYFGIPTIDTIVIDSAIAPTFTLGLRSSMRRESQEFVNYTLWNEPLAGLLTSRRALIDEGLAGVYGVPFPPAGAAVAADGFALTTLPENRAGLITQAGFLTARSRPDTASVVGRGLLLNATMLCGINPPFPEALATMIETVSASLEGLTARGQSEARQTTAPCSGCHPGFDPFGVALLNYDIIGTFVEVDGQGRPIDASVILPANATGATAANAVEMANILATGVLANGASPFATCMGSNLVRYSLAEGASVTVNTCAAQTVAERFAASGDLSFSSMIREVAASDTFAMRLGGTASVLPTAANPTDPTTAGGTL